MPATAERIIYQPNPGPQWNFHSSPAFELLYGGAAGGGKSVALVAEAMRQANRKGYSALLLRRTFPQLSQKGGLLPISQDIYPKAGAVFNSAGNTWTFGSGAAVRFGHMQNKDDFLNYQGGEYQFIGFDELSQFEEDQYRYLFSRLRAPKELGLRMYIRAASNPGSLWVKQRWAAWLDKKHPRPAKPGELRWYVSDGDGDREVPKGTAGAWSRTFIPASYRDNPALDPVEYERSLAVLPYIERMRLMNGDWDISEGKGLVINRAWIDVVPPTASKSEKWVRFWDLAATEKKLKNDPDFTATCLLGTETFDYWIQLERQRLSPNGVMQWILDTAKKEPGVTVAVEQEGGASGKIVIDNIGLEMAKIGRIFHGIRPQGDKVTRAQLWAAFAERGKVHLVPGITPTDEILSEFHSFPDPHMHDDMVDAVSGAWVTYHRYMGGLSSIVVEE